MRDEPVPCAGGGASPGPREVKTPEIFCLSVAAPSPVRLGFSWERRNYCLRLPLRSSLLVASYLLLVLLLLLICSPLPLRCKYLCTQPQPQPQLVVSSNKQ
jgi:hypothetical protein